MTVTCIKLRKYSKFRSLHFNTTRSVAGQSQKLSQNLNKKRKKISPRVKKSKANRDFSSVCAGKPTMAGKLRVTLGHSNLSNVVRKMASKRNMAVALETWS